MENPYAPPGTTVPTEGDGPLEEPKPTLTPAASNGLLVLACGFAISAILSAVYGWLMSTPVYVDSVPDGMLGSIMWGLALLTRFGLGVGYLMCTFVPAKTNATQWAVSAAFMHYVGGVMGGSATTDTMVVMVVCFFGAPALFWLCLYRVAKWCESERLQQATARLAWVGIIALLLSVVGSTAFLLAGTPRQTYFAEQVFGVVSGLLAAATWLYYAWVAWQFQRELR